MWIVAVDIAAVVVGLALVALLIWVIIVKRAIKLSRQLAELTSKTEALSKDLTTRTAQPAHRPRTASRT